MVKILATRFAHSEGHTDLCFDDSGTHMLTCGNDGDVRIWRGLDDDDAVSHRIGEHVFAIAYYDGKFATASDSMSVQIYSFPDGAPDGILTRFTAPATCMCYNRTGTLLLCGASDFMIKLVSVVDKTCKVFQGHQAPVICVALDPLEEYVASSSCDGTVRIWTVEEQLCEMSWNVLPKSNDVCNSKTLCKLSWEPISGEFLAVPIEKEIRVFKRETWDLSFTLQVSSIKDLISICAFSPCGKFIAAAYCNGLILVWDFVKKNCIEKISHEKNFGICSLAWNPKQNGEIAYCDTMGNLGILEEVLPEQHKKEQALAVSAVSASADLFDGSDDDLILTAAMGEQKQNNDSDNDDEFDIGKQKARLKAILEDDDDNSNSLPSIPTMVDKPVASSGLLSGLCKPAVLQAAFQPSSTPVELSHRFMVWNSVGVIRAYNTEEENTIDIEFHDTATHHPLHISNYQNFTMADISAAAVVLAAEGSNDEDDEKTPSQLMCMHFSSWDMCKEWTVTMPQSENINALCIGEGWIAVATDERNVRIFSIGGLQREIFSITGPVVSMSGQGNQLLITFHLGVGIPGDQNIGVSLYVLGSKRSPILDNARLPLRAKSKLSWLGFSAEGTPFTADSSGAVRILNRAFNNAWTQVANTKSNIKGKSDNYWLVGITENPPQIRCILCKGKSYPSTLPRPTVTVLPFQLPMCEISSEKSQLEEKYWRSKILTGFFNYSATLDLNFDEQERATCTEEQQEALLRLFALCCRADQEFRAYEICDTATEQTVRLAIKYASRMKHLNLANRLNKLIMSKIEEADNQAEEEEEEDFRRNLDVVHNHEASEWAYINNKQSTRHLKDKQGDHVPNGEADLEPLLDENDEDETAEDGVEESPLLKNPARKPVQKKLSSTADVKNPFKLPSQSPKSDEKLQGTRVFDKLQKPPKQNKTSNNTWLTNVSAGKKRVKCSKTMQPLQKNKVQPTLSEKFQVPVACPEPNAENDAASAKFGFELWLEVHREEVKEEHPDLSEADIIKLCAKRFRLLSPEEKEQWNNKDSSDSKSIVSTLNDENKKRKRDDFEEDNYSELQDAYVSPVKKSVSGIAKLTKFAFTKN